ncbi:MAG: hypothetical protein FWH48_07360, partial [Oscillospiraceae bacterium]|nr:hypothetical protein [Oscillospiraceae bacterium]
MKKRLLCIMLASLFLLPLIGSIPISAADGSYRYSISFDYEMTGASDSFDFLFNQRTNNNTNDYLRWRFTANSVQPSKRGSYLNLIVTSYRWNDYTASPLPTSATVGSVINVRIDVYADDIETYINGELCNTTTFATINSADTRNGTFAPNPTSQVGLNSRNNTGTKYMDNLVGINYTGDSPDYMFYAIFDSVNPFSGAGTSLVGGRLEIAGGTSGTISGTSDTTHRWINLSQAVLPPSMALPIIIGEFSEYNPDDYVSWAWPQFQRALDAALVVKNNPESTEANFGDAITMLNTAKTRLTSATENA